MSINDSDGREIITLGTIHAYAFRLLIWIGIIATPSAFIMFMNHSKTLDLHEWRIASLEQRSSRNGSVSQSINVGSADTAKMAEQSGRTYLTTQEVAKREGVTDRTVINYIESEQIYPPPRKEGKSWVIAENYVILPKDSENCGNAEQQ